MVLVGWSVLFFAAISYTYYHQIILSNSQRNLKVSFLNIGQGDSMLIQTPDNHSFIIDGGPPTGDVLSILGSIFPFYIHHIDGALATHPDQDHVAGLIPILNSYHPSVFFWDGLNSGTLTDISLMGAAQQNTENYKMFKLMARRGTKIILDKKDDIELQILFPNQDVSTWIKDTNDGSIVARLTYGKTSFLFTGDSPIDVEHYFVTNFPIPHTDVLKVGHHGSKTSTSDEFVKMLTPTYGIISDGVNNKYGFPHKEVLDILNQNNVKILRTDQLGTITIDSNGNTLKVE
jgi:competence protein ComEC